MSHNTAVFQRVKDRLALLPECLFWDVVRSGETIQVQPDDDLGIQGSLDAITAVFPLAEPWKPSWQSGTHWWTYSAVTEDGITLYVYADKTTPHPGHCDCVPCLARREEGEPVAAAKEVGGGV